MFRVHVFNFVFTLSISENAFPTIFVGLGFFDVLLAFSALIMNPRNLIGFSVILVMTVFSLESSNFNLCLKYLLIIMIFQNPIGF